ncbi:MAG: membrane bound O-acyl transferase family-domain-containing protein, partial [Planctomycetaceae bacterium]|nr:membrane bound O-acyl transferase family-domain-containing protein [Planctomycetaceae bacterium]
RPQPNRLAWLMFATGWPGMRPSTFADVPGPPRRVRSLLYQGLVNLLAGVVLSLLAWNVIQQSAGSVPSPGRLLVASALLMPGLSLILHFGLFNLLAGLWRRIGGDCHALFRAPLRSTSLTEFWGRRWNLAFSEMTALTVYRPLRRLTGNRLASIVAFLFSGVLHELAISLPVRQGYGLPTLYFVLHAIAMQIEKVLADCGKPINSSRLAGRCWTAVWLVLPLPLLFHVPFLRGCLWPLLGLNLPGPVGH